MTRIAYGFAADDQDDEWLGAYATREEAIAEGAKHFALTDGDTFFVCRGEYPDMGKFIPDAESIIEMLRESLDDECNVDGQEIEVTGGTEELNEFLRDWARRNLKPSMWVKVGDAELVVVGEAKEPA
jgi:hypothetical protein